MKGGGLESTSPGGESGDYEMAVRSGAAEALSRPVGVKVMKDRELKVTVWRVPLDKNGATRHPFTLTDTEIVIISQPFYQV